MHSILSNDLTQSIYHLYNSKIWPTQLLLIFFGVMGFYFCFKMRRYRTNFVSIILLGLWIWCSFFFFPIISNKIGYIAYFFIPIFFAYGILIFYYASYKKIFLFKIDFDLQGFVAIFLATYALVIKIFLGEFVLGLDRLTSSSFGTPSLLSIYTLALISNVYGKKKFILLVPPLFWLLIEIIFVGFYEPLDFAIFIIACLYSLIYLKKIKALPET